MDTPAPSPAQPERTLGEGFRIGARTGIRGHVHLHEGDGPVAVQIAVWRYRGTQPLPRFLESLSRDAEGWSALRHGNLATTLEIGRAKGELLCYWIQEAVSPDPVGHRPVTLESRLEEHPILAPDVALHIALQLGHALVQVHRGDLIHGDLDPANVLLVGPSDRATLIWGGLAHRIEAAGMDAGRGTARPLAEVSPEALAGGDPGAPGDVYGLAALTYRMLSGKPPFLVRRQGAPPGLSPGEELEPLPKHVSPGLVRTLTSCLMRDPQRRPDLQRLLDEMVEIEGGIRGAAVPSGAWAPAPVERGSLPEVPPSVDHALTNTPGRTAPRVGDRVRSLLPRDGSFEPPLSHPPVHAGSARGDSPFWAVMAAAALMSLVVIGGVALLARLSNITPTAPVEIIAAATPAVDEGPARLIISSSPPNAEVYEDEIFLGRTPIDVPMEGDEDSEIRTFELRLDGYVTMTMRQPWLDTSRSFLVSLNPVQVPEPGARVAPPAAPRIIEIPVPVPVPVQVLAPPSEADPDGHPDPDLPPMREIR